MTDPAPAGSVTPAGPVSQAGPLTPAHYDVWISHRRRDPLDYGFGQRSRSWLVDLDALPRLPRGLGWLCRFSAADHRLSDGPLAQSLRADVDRFLAGHGVGRQSTILMLANPRVLGYVFNPLSVFYCYDERGELRHAVAEVRNTYGGRHSYLLSLDETGHAETDKRFFVSPFYPVDGHYTMRLPEPGAALTVAVTLHRQADRPFSAVLTGRRRGEEPASLWAALRSPLVTRAVMLGIRRHGIALYLKGLRPLRPDRDPAASSPPGAGDSNASDSNASDSDKAQVEERRYEQHHAGIRSGN